MTSAGLDGFPDDHRVPFTSSGDLSPATREAIESSLGGADIVGLGEASHGTRETAQLNHRLVRALVASCGVRTVAIETDFAATLALDRFVRGEVDSLVDAIDALGLWVWKIDTLADTLVWLRSFNEARPDADRVRVVGVSLDTPATTADALRANLAQAGVSYPDAVEADLEAVATQDVSTMEAPQRQEYLTTAMNIAETVRTELDVATPAPTSRIHRERTAWLCRHLELVARWNERRFASEGRFDADAFAYRDACMAEATAWWADRDPGQGVVLWAHNAHVKRGTFDMPHDWAAGHTMGEHLANRFGAAYRPIATTFGRGRFRAIDTTDPTDDRRPRTLSVSEPVSGAVANLLDDGTARPVYADIAGAVDEYGTDVLGDEPHHIRGIPATVDSTAEPSQRYLETDVAASFDGLVFVPEVQPTEPIDVSGQS